MFHMLLLTIGKFSNIQTELPSSLSHQMSNSMASKESLLPYVQKTCFELIDTFELYFENLYKSLSKLNRLFWPLLF